MKVDPLLSVQTVPEIQCGDLQVCCGQAARLCDAEILFYTALSHGGTCWYHTIEGTQAYSAADVLNEGLCDVTLGFGYGLSVMGACDSAVETYPYTLLAFSELAASCRKPTFTDSPLPVLFCEPGNKLSQKSPGADMFIVGKGKVKRLVETVIPFVGPGAYGDEAYRKWLRKNAGKLYIGLRGPVSDVVLPGRNSSGLAYGAGQHVMYSCPYEGVERTNSLLRVNDHGLSTFKRIFGK